MAKFLFTVWPFQGHYFPLIAIAQELQQRGHECAFFSGAQACAVAEKEGFRCFPFAHVDEAKLTALMAARTGQPGDWHSVRQFQQLLRSWLVDTIPQQVQDLESILGSWRPDVIACDPTMWGPMLILHERDRIPVALCSFVPVCMIPGKDVPPFGLGMAAGKDPWSQLKIRTVKAVLDLGSTPFRRAANDVRRRYGLRPLEISVTEYTGQMPLHLVPSAPEFDYNRTDLPPSVHYVGPCVWNRPSTEPPALWLDTLPHDQPWIHVSEGTQHIGEAFLTKAAIQGLADLPAQVIVTTGGRQIDATAEFGPVAANMHLVRWVSHSALLPQTDVVVTTGGAGTVLATLQAGKPLILIPTEWDKPEIAQRVVTAGAGIRLSPQQCTPARIRAAVEQVLGDPSFGQNAQHISRVFSRYRGAAQAAELLETLA